MTIQDLYQQCVEETKAYLEQRLKNAKQCFELMRHALELDKTEAFSHIYNIYINLVRSWVYRHPAYDSTNEPLDYFASNAFASFYFANRREKFQKIETIGGALMYLKACVHTSIMQHIRYNKPMNELEENDVVLSSDMDRDLLASQIWERIQTVLDDPDDLLLANLRFIQNVKPNEITEVYGDKWATARDVSVSLQRIKRTLSKDNILYSLLIDANHKIR